MTKHMISDAAQDEIIRWAVERTRIRNTCKKMGNLLSRVHERYRITGNAFLILVSALSEDLNAPFPANRRERELVNEYVVRDGRVPSLLRSFKKCQYVLQRAKQEMFLLDCANILNEHYLFIRLPELYSRLEDTIGKIGSINKTIARHLENGVRCNNRIIWGNNWLMGEIHIARHREWLLLLPEVRHAIDVLGMSEEEAIEEGMVKPEDILDRTMTPIAADNVCDDNDPVETWCKMFGRYYAEDQLIETYWEQLMVTESNDDEDKGNDENEEPNQMPTGPPQLAPAIQFL